MKVQYVNYYRVSTSRQGQSGLGLEGQRIAVAQYVATTGGTVAAEFTEIESGKKADRPELAKAINLCKLHGYTLCVAKLDRLARNLHFVTTLQRSGVAFCSVDNPHATPFVIHILCAVAEQEAISISSRVRSALAVARQRGTKLGNPNYQDSIKRATTGNQTQADTYSARLLPVIKEIQAANVTSLRAIAHCLNVRGFLSRTGKPFAAQTVKNVLCRAESHPSLA